MFNPMGNDFLMQRIQQERQMQQYQPQQQQFAPQPAQPTMQPPQPQYVVRPVTNVQEAQAAMIDPFNINLFTDFNNGLIHFKRINNNGIAEFFTFKLESNEQPKNDPLQGVYERLDSIESILKERDSNVSKSTAKPKSKSANDIPETE